MYRLFLLGTKKGVGGYIHCKSVEGGMKIREHRAYVQPIVIIAQIFYIFSNLSLIILAYSLILLSCDMYIMMS